MKRFTLPAVLLTLAGFALACGGEEETTVEPEIVLIPVPVEAETPEVEEEEVEEEEAPTIEERMDDLGDDGHQGTLKAGGEKKGTTGSTGGKTTGTTSGSGGKKTTGGSGGKKSGSGGKKSGSGGKKK
jgi:hypothetical protein